MEAPDYSSSLAQVESVEAESPGNSLKDVVERSERGHSHCGVRSRFSTVSFSV